MRLSREQVIERLCRLTEEVCQEAIGHSEPSDCFCGKGGFWGTGLYDDSRYQNAGKALEFIEEATRNAIAIRKLMAPKEERTTDD